MNPNKYYEFNYNGEQYIVPREWIEEHDKQIRAEVIEEFLKKDKECPERNEECNYMYSEITCIECIAEQLKEQNKWIED